MSLRVQKLMDLMNDLAPPHLALKNDSIGLQIGHPEEEINNILTTLDVDEQALAAAEKYDANLVVSHHPLIFTPLTAIDYRRPDGNIIKEIIRRRINVFVAHTNLDIAPTGVNNLLCNILDVEKAGVLEITRQENLLKLVVFVPAGYEENLRDGIASAGAGWIGSYSHCTFQSAGTGTFLPLENTEPFIGERGKLEKVDEFRLETVLPASRQKEVKEALLQNHPYEEPAYEFYKLEEAGFPLGLGCWGTLTEPLPLKELARKCRQVLGSDTIRYWGDNDAQAHKIALCGGSGGNLISRALQREADVFISGDFKYHDIQYARSMGLNLIDAGHYGTEYPLVPWLAQYLQDKLRAWGAQNSVRPVSGGGLDENILPEG